MAGAYCISKLWNQNKEMAEINIEKKKKSVWPWLLLLVLVALIAWAIYELTSDKNEVEEVEAPATGVVLPAQPQPFFYASN
jgi:flagellar basal body-associated protein FliL